MTAAELWETLKKEVLWKSPRDIEDLHFTEDEKAIAIIQQAMRESNEEFKAAWDYFRRTGRTDFKRP